MADREHVAVCVLGDVGRSPRMQYHCVSLSKLEGTQVHLIGYRGERCIGDVENSPRISQYLIGTPFAKWSRKWFFIYAPLKVLYQLLVLFWTLLITIPAPRAILIQNPPSIPALLAVWLAARLRGAKMVVDWHNFGYTVLGLNLGPKHLLVTVSRWYETWFARRADAHLCVTKAMKVWLKDNWGVDATVLYDKPPSFFRPTTLQEQHELFLRLAPDLPQVVMKKDIPFGSGWKEAFTTSADDNDDNGEEGTEAAADGGKKTVTKRRRSRSKSTSATATTGTPSRTLFTEMGPNGVVRSREDRPALLISSTSWTEDEDFGILLDALVRLDTVAAAAAPSSMSKNNNNNTPKKLPSSSLFPRFLVVVTGKGPQRAMYESKMAELKLSHVMIRTMWLAASDYPLLLGAADLGVCLHFSTSGLDLPMKVVDMFGAGLPVCAVNYACLNELVQDNVNGLVFRNSAQLADQFVRLFTGFRGGAGSNTTTADVSTLTTKTTTAIAGGVGGGVKTPAQRSTSKGRKQVSAEAEEDSDDNNNDNSSSSNKYNKNKNNFSTASSDTELGRLRRGVGIFQGIRWQDNWDRSAAPIFRRIRR